MQPIEGRSVGPLGNPLENGKVTGYVKIGSTGTEV